MIIHNMPNNICTNSADSAAIGELIILVIFTGEPNTGTGFLGPEWMFKYVFRFV